MTVADAVADYLDHLHSLKHSERTEEENRYTLRRFACWLEQACEVTDIQRMYSNHVAAWHRHLCDSKNQQGHPLKARTINKHLSFTRSFIHYLADRGMASKKWFDLLPSVKEPSTLPGGVLSHADVRKLLRKINTDSPEGHRNRALLELLYSTGIRARELVGLDVNDLNFDHGTALIQGKGNKERMVPIGKTALRYLESYVVAVRPYLARRNVESCSALFLNVQGNRFAYHSLQRLMRKLRRRHGLGEHVTAHTFRRSCTTELIRSGANIYHVKELLGHESVQTLRHYTRLTIVDLKKTHEKCHPRERDQ